MGVFEITGSDLAGRTGRIETNHGRVETPAFVPVIHPVRQSVPAAQMRAMGFDLVITNAYIARNAYGEEAVRRGIHDVIGHDGAVMTDSGGYQVLEYGGVPVSPDEMAAFERGIMTDIAIPLDRPTGFGMPEKRAASYVRHTLAVCKKTLADAADNGQVWAGPVQGGEHSALVSRSARSLVRMGYRMLALGSPVEFMESYEYRLLAGMIAAARREIPRDIPLHLFGAGHPLTIPLAVALGCDTFDSASYMLYARQDRYITGDGTRHLRDIAHFPCSCPACSGTTPSEARALGAGERAGLLAVHNLHAIRLEVDSTRQAIHEGRLWEHVMKKARAHPRLYEAAGVLTGSPDLLSPGTPAFKERAVFLFGSEDQHRPEVLAFHAAVRRFRTKKRRMVITAEPAAKPGYLSRQYADLRRRVRDADSCQFFHYSPHLGPIPIELSDLFPAAHHEAARIPRDPAAYAEFARTWGILFENNAFEEVRYDAGDAFLAHFVRGLPRGVRRRPLGGGADAPRGSRQK